MVWTCPSIGKRPALAAPDAAPLRGGAECWVTPRVRRIATGLAARVRQPYGGRRTTRAEEVVQPGEQRPTDQAVEERPHASDEAPSEGQVVATIDVPNPGRIGTGSIKGHHPPRQRGTPSPQTTAHVNANAFTSSLMVVSPYHSAESQPAADASRLLGLGIDRCHSVQRVPK